MDITTASAAWEADQRARNRRPLTIRSNTRAIGRVAGELGWCKVADFTASAALGWLTERRERGGVSPATYNRDLYALKAFGAFLEAGGWLANPMVGAQPATAEHVGARALTVEEARALYAEACRTDGRAKRRRARGLFWATMLYTGLRHSECGQLEWGSLDLGERPVLVVSSAWSKNRKGSVLALHPTIVDLLRAHKEGPFTTSCKVWQTVPGRQEFDDDRIRAGVCKVDRTGRRASPHSLRKSFGTWLMAAGVNQAIVSHLLRHQQGGVTQTYCCPSWEQERAALAMLPDVAKMSNVGV